MCNEFHMLVEENDWRYIAQCEHKTIHLRWDHLTISLPPHAFAQFARNILEESARHRELATVATNPNAKATLRLRLNTVLVEFTGTDLLALRPLLQRAIERLTNDAPLPKLPATESPATNTPPSLQPCPQPMQFALAQYLN